MSNPVVTAIIIFLNGGSYLQEAIESVCQQSYTQWELLLVDDGSTDGSSAVARRYAAQYENIHYLEHPEHENRGMSASRNRGIEAAQGCYLSFLDADDRWLPDHLSQHIALIEAHPQVGMVYGNTRYWYPEAPQMDFVPALGIAPDQVYPPPVLLPLFISGQAAVPCTCSLLIRREVALAVQGFEESFPGMYEDQAFYAKICLTAPVYVAGTTLAWYRQHPDSNCAVTETKGEAAAARRHFLHWLLAYMQQQQLKDEATILAARRALWLLPPTSKSSAKFRWGRKWLVRLETALLPRPLQRWLWQQNR